MICKKCGAENPEEVTFCTQCGESLTQPEEPKKKTDPAKRKRVIQIAAIAAGLLCLVLIISSLLGGSAAEDAAEDLCKSLKELDLNTTISMISPAVLDYISDSLDLENIKYEVIRSEELDNDYVRTIDERYALRFGTAEGYINAAYVVYLRAAVSGKALSRDEISLIMVEIDGEWYLDPLATADEIDEADWNKDALHINWN